MREVTIEEVADLLNRLAATAPSMRTKQALIDALSDEAVDMLQSMLSETLP